MNLKNIFASIRHKPIATISDHTLDDLNQHLVQLSALSNEGWIDSMIAQIHNARTSRISQHMLVDIGRNLIGQFLHMMFEEIAKNNINIATFYQESILRNSTKMIVGTTPYVFPSILQDFLDTVGLEVLIYSLRSFGKWNASYTSGTIMAEDVGIYYKHLHYIHCENIHTSHMLRIQMHYKKFEPVSSYQGGEVSAHMHIITTQMLEALKHIVGFVQK